MQSSDKDETIRTYEKIAPDYSKANYDPFWIEEFERYKALVSGKKVLDVGCGTGRDSAVFVRAGFDYTGIDLSSAMLKIAAERVPQATFKVMDFFHLEFPDESFDGFWAAAAYLHVPKAEVLEPLREAKRVIKRGGVGFVSLKEKNGMDEGMVTQERFGGTISRYFAFYEQDEFKAKLLEAGFEVVEDTKYHEDDERRTVWLGYFVRKP